ncbi:uncharacterized protein A4U43_C07F38260 [Asparagus officinalis]|uniref:Protein DETOXIFICATION n=1 Tax=Asparagus officinalis TaxID=4686 RepID=A0A5P1ELX7_ASPOF|nr:uncharacterized protein A4U43_C07F38260 [Asparagus officinalis]
MFAGHLGDLEVVGATLRNSRSPVTISAPNVPAVLDRLEWSPQDSLCSRVSNEKGAGNTKKAKNAVSVTLKLSFFLALSNLLSLVFGHNLWARCFTINPVIVQEFASLAPLLSLSILLYSAQGVLRGVAIGCGWQHLVAWTNLVAFYLISIPLAILFRLKLGIHDKGSTGSI